MAVTVLLLLSANRRSMRMPRRAHRLSRVLIHLLEKR